MASHPPAQCCTIGVKHEGSASGDLIKIGEVETYITTPSQPSDAAILILPDVIGHAFTNVQLIADQFAANGYLTIIPDMFHGDALPLNRPADFDFMAWRGKHTTEKIDPVVAAAIKYLREEKGVKKIGGVGYCFGAKYVARFLNKKGGLDAGYVAHPSFVEEEEVKGIEGPFSIAAAETDQIFPPEKRRATEDILFKMDIPWQINLYSDVVHGFAVRAELTEPRVKWAKEQAFFQAVQWFDEYVKKDGGAKL